MLKDNRQTIMIWYSYLANSQTSTVQRRQTSLAKLIGVLGDNNKNTPRNKQPTKLRSAFHLVHDSSQDVTRPTSGKIAAAQGGAGRETAWRIIGEAWLSWDVMAEEGCFPALPPEAQAHFKTPL